MQKSLLVGAISALILSACSSVPKNETQQEVPDKQPASEAPNYVPSQGSSNVPGKQPSQKPSQSSSSEKKPAKIGGSGSGSSLSYTGSGNRVIGTPGFSSNAAASQQSGGISGNPSVIQRSPLKPLTKEQLKAYLNFKVNNPKSAETQKRFNQLIAANGDQNYDLLFLNNEVNEPESFDKLLGKGANVGTVRGKTSDKDKTVQLSYAAWGGDDVFVAKTYEETPLTVDNLAVEKGNLILGIFTESNTLEQLKTSQAKAQYSGKALYSVIEGAFSYEVDFAQGIGKGQISALDGANGNQLPNLVLQEATGIKAISALGEGVQGFSLDSAGVAKDLAAGNEIITDSSYQLGFFGSEAQEIAGQAQFSVDGNKYDVILGGKKEENTVSNNGMTNSYQPISFPPTPIAKP